MKVTGTFEVKMSAEPPYDVVDGVALARARFDKRFQGPLEAESVVHMIGARGPIQGSGAYVAVERVVGALQGRRGTFVLVHLGLMDRGAQSLTVRIAPGSGTGELRGVSGRLDIQIVEGQHRYELDYEIEPEAAA